MVVNNEVLDEQDTQEPGNSALSKTAWHISILELVGFFALQCQETHFKHIMVLIETMLDVFRQIAACNTKTSHTYKSLLMRCLSHQQLSDHEGCHDLGFISGTLDCINKY